MFIVHTDGQTYREFGRLQKERPQTLYNKLIWLQIIATSLLAGRRHRRCWQIHTYWGPCQYVKQQHQQLSPSRVRNWLLLAESSQWFEIKLDPRPPCRSVQ